MLIRPAAGHPTPSADSAAYSRQRMVDLAPGTVVGNYEVVGLIGSGGMASVYRDRHTALGSEHALKVLDPLLVRDPAIRERFLNEGRIQAQLRHPAIVSVTDLVSAPGIAGLVAEYIDGGDLDTWIAERGGTPDPETGDRCSYRSLTPWTSPTGRASFIGTSNPPTCSSGAAQREANSLDWLTSGSRRYWTVERLTKTGSEREGGETRPAPASELGRFDT